MAPRPTERRGQLLAGSYRIEALLAQGGVGNVYLARHERVGRRVAVKLLRSGSDEDPTALERFWREARTAGALETEHVPSVLDFGVSDSGEPYLVMEQLIGEDLAHLLARGPLSVPRAVGIAVQIGRALALAHEAGIVHRDIKPSNLFLCRRSDGRDWVKVLDFGVAKALDGPRLTRSGAPVGTALYMSPEQARGGEVDARADLYALGAVLYEMLAGRPPHDGDNTNAVLYAILHAPVPPLGSLRSGLPHGLEQAVHALLAAEAADRPADAHAALALLEPYAPGAFEVTPAATTLPTASTTSDRLATESGVTLARPWPARGPRALALLGCGLAGVLLGAMVRGDRDAAPPASATLVDVGLRARMDASTPASPPSGAWAFPTAGTLAQSATTPADGSEPRASGAAPASTDVPARVEVPTAGSTARVPRSGAAASSTGQSSALRGGGPGPSHAAPAPLEPVAAPGSSPPAPTADDASARRPRSSSPGVLDRVDRTLPF